jgi:hypothetical protein
MKRGSKARAAVDMVEMSAGPAAEVKPAAGQRSYNTPLLSIENCCCSSPVHPRRRAVPILPLALAALLPAARLAAQPGPRTPPPPTDAAPAADTPAAPVAPTPPPGPPPDSPGPTWPGWPPPADPGAALLTPPAVARDRLYIDAGLEAILLGDLRRAEALFSRAALEASTPELRASAALLAQRTAALADRRSELPPVVSRRAPAPRAARPATARPVFLLTTTVLGVAAWGWTLPMALGVDDSEDARATVGLYMLTAAGSFIVPYMLTRSREVTWGQANMAFYGGTRGLEYGLLISNIVFGEEGGNIDGDSERAFAASLLLGSISGVIAGSWWAGSSRMSAGDARTVAVWGDYGLFAGFVTGHVFGWDDLTGEFGEPRFDARARATAASGAVGTVLGLTVGRQLSLARTNSWGDGEVMRGAGLLGVMAGLTTAVGFGYDDSSRSTLLTMAIGGGLGLAGGDLLVRNTDFSVGESILTDLALVSGGLGAAGLAYLVAPNADGAAYLLAGTLGAAVGGGLSYYVLRDNGTSRTRAGRPPSVALVPQFGRNGRAGVTVYGTFN